ncbi:hypothetical protein C0J52_19776 [Blattella germanica]|nr:hypothetical protein C0J52_19776 [Blattella germanica]
MKIDELPHAASSQVADVLDFSKGPSHTVPSVIVAKIMEKLREHERENIPPSSVASAPALGVPTPATPVTSASGKFSKAARRVLTRTAVLGALPLARQQQQQSVLTPDNRRFLDNQGSKSPEVPRKRMIIGHRSYTFGCDGDLIELEPIKDPITPITQPIHFPPKPKPLVHKDSVLSNATSLSLTSVDSDSDTDDHSSSFGLQQRRNLSSSPPKPLMFSTPNLSEDSEVLHLQRMYLPFSPVSKRMSSTSLSSWESEAISPINSLPDMRPGMRHLSTDEPLSEQEEHEDGGLKMSTKRSNRFHSTPDSPLLTSWPMRYESIDEDVEMRSDQSPSLLSTSTSELSHDTQSKSSDGQVPYYGKSIEQQTELTESRLAELEELPINTSELNGNEYELNNEEIEESSESKSDKSHEQQVQIQKHVISLLQLRRSSLKRQQRVLDDEEPVAVTDSAEETKEADSILSDSENVNRTWVERSKADVDEEAMYDSDVFMDTAPISETVDAGVLEKQSTKNENIDTEESKLQDIQEQNCVLSLETTNFADISMEQTKIQLTNCEEESIEPHHTKTQQSVLTPDNRRFLDNQGSKSPEVPRKRMIIGHRSYTFGCDGDLIELEPIKDPITPITQPIHFPPKPKPLVHKDSVLSNATSLSLTSVDSDSDTDDHSSSFGLQQRRNLSSSPPKPLMFSTPNLSEDSEVLHLQRMYLPFSPVSKRMSSTSLSSWESEAISPINSLPDMRPGMRHLSTDEPLSEQEEHEDGGLKMSTKRSNRFHSTPDSPLLTSWPMRYESIDEDVEMRSDQSPSLLSTSTSELSHDTQSKSSDGQVPYYGKSIEQQTELTESRLAELEELPINTSELNGNEYELNNEEIEESSESKSDKSHEQQVQIQKHVISLLQLRRSSLKRQQRVLDDEEPVAVTDSAEETKEADSILSDSENVNRTWVERSKADVDEEAMYDSDVFMDTAPISETVDAGVLEKQSTKNENIDTEESKLQDIQEQNCVLSLETTNFADISMEQTKIQLTNCEEKSIEPQHTKTINTCAEDEAGIAMLSRARSDSSGFLDGDSEIYSMRMLANGNGSDMQIESSQQDVSNSDMINVNSIKSENVNSDLNLGSTVDVNDLNSTSLVLDSEGTSSAINDRDLPKNLLQELSSVKDWMESNSFTKFTDISVSDTETCAITKETEKEIENNPLLELNDRKALEKQNSNSSVNSSKKASVESAISPLVRSSLSLYQESSSGRTLSGNPTLVQHLTVDSKELVRQRTSSLRGIEDTSSMSLANVRRVKSAPNCLEHLTSRDELVRGSSWSSYSNMFSFCSDESVIHVGLQRANTSRGSDKRLSDVNDGTLKREFSMEVDSVISEQEHKATNTSDPPVSTRYLKPNAFPYGRGAKRSASDPSAMSGRSVKDLRELVGELALLRLQGDAVRAGLAAYGRQLVGGQADVQNGSHEVAEASKEMQAVREVRDRIAAELRRVADLLEEQPPHRVADITGQMAVLLREQTRLCRQLESLSCVSSPSIFVEPAPCCSVLEAVREENRRLQTLVERNSLELVEIRKLLKELVAVKKS